MLKIMMSYTDEMVTTKKVFHGQAFQDILLGTYPSPDILCDV